MSDLAEQAGLGPLVNDPADAAWVCKHCGGGDFYADVTVSGWVDGDVVGDGRGKPQFESSGRVEVDAYDHEVEKYVCNGCRADAWRLEQLVVPAPAASDAPIAPCGRCDHGRAEHPERRASALRERGFERGPMPCTHEGCDCHDFYDREVAEAGQPPATLAVLGRAAA